MVAVASCFAQILALIDRTDFARAVRQHAAEQATKGFSYWELFVTMLFCQMRNAHSLREICGDLATALGKLVHLGVRRTPTRSTLAYANAHRPWRLYETLFYQVLTQCQAVASLKRRRVRFKHLLQTLDTTLIELCATVFDWAWFVRTKGAIKLHLQLDQQGCLPCWALVTDGDARQMSAWRSGSPLRRAPSSRWIAATWTMPSIIRWTTTRVWVVTRPRTNMRYHVLDRRPVPTHSSVLVDEVIRLTGLHAADRCPVPLRQVTIWDETQQRPLTFLTNLMHLAASTIAAIYKERWQLELLSKALKQHLTIKTFVGTSEHAVQVQI